MKLRRRRTARPARCLYFVRWLRSIELPYSAQYHPRNRDWPILSTSTHSKVGAEGPTPQSEVLRMRPAGSARPVHRSSRRRRRPPDGGDDGANEEAAYDNLNLPGAFEDDDGGSSEETCAVCRAARVRW